MPCPTCRFDLWPGETLGIVGETGSGKSTLARSLLQAPPPKSGAVIFQGTRIWSGCGAVRLLDTRRHLQMVFQDPFGSLDPKWRVADIVEEPLVAYRIGDRGGAPAAGARGAGPGRPRPGQLRPAPPPGTVRRAGPAGRDRPRGRAVTRADHLRRGGVLARRAHPGAGAQPVRAAARRARPVLPVHRPRPRAGQAGQRPGRGHVPGQAVRDAGPPGPSIPTRCTPTPSRCWNPSPAPTRSRPRSSAHATIRGEPPSPIHPPSGCRFRTRCPRAQERCALEEPPMLQLAEGHSVACHFPLPAGPAPPGPPLPPPARNSSGAREPKGG